MIKNNIEKLTVFTKPENSPGYLLWHVSLAWRRLIEETLKPLNLTHPQFVVLTIAAWLMRNGENITQIDISKASGLDPNTISQILKGLELKNFIKRTRSTNERSKNPELTNLGSIVLAQALPAVEKADAKFFESLASQEISSLITIFGKLISKK